MSMPVVFGLVAMSALAIIEPYRMRRITSFLDPWADQQGDGYQLSNALMAVGRGEWTGVGLGNSVQKLYYLPEAHTDFIFSVTAEELGFLSAPALIVALYALLAGRAFWIWHALRGNEAPLLRLHRLRHRPVDQHAELRLDRREPGHLLPTKGLTLPLTSSGFLDARAARLSMRAPPGGTTPAGLSSEAVPSPFRSSPARYPDRRTTGKT